MEGKVCNRCGEFKVLGEFHRDSYKPDGYRGVCKGCVKVRTRHLATERKEANSVISKDRDSSYSSLINIEVLKGMVASAIDYKSKEVTGKRQNGGIYFLWGKEDELLYVGKAVDIRDRVAHHKSVKSWADEICRTTLIFCNSKNEREMLEGIFIHVLFPKYNYENVSHKTKITC